MKKLFLVIGLMTSVIFCNAQSTYEPEFIGETNLLCISGSDTISMALDKENAKIKSKAGAYLYLTGIGSVKTRIHVEGNTSSCVAKPDCAYRLVVRSANNDTDPNTFIQLIQFEVKKNERRCEIGKINTFKGSSSGTEQLIEYKAKRYGESSYLLSFDPVVPGEYGVFMSNPDARDEKRMIIYCFSVK